MSTAGVARSGWGQQVVAAGMRIRGRMSCLTTSGTRDRGTEQLVDEQLELAFAAVAAEPGVHRLGEWWSGRRIESVLEASFRQRNAYHGAARALRNRLVVVTLLVLVIAAGLVVTQLFIPQAPVLPSPKHDRSARWVTMLLVMFFGALGALITTIPVMAALPRVASPYNFPLQQSFMKIAVGTLTGVVGVVVIGLPSTTGTGHPTFGALVGAAIVFGAGQQVVTRFLDTRAQQVVDAMPALAKATSG